MKQEAVGWLASPAGHEFMEWFRRELGLDDTLTPQQIYNKHRGMHSPPVPVDMYEVAITEGRRQAYAKLKALADMHREDK